MAWPDALNTCSQFILSGSTASSISRVGAALATSGRQQLRPRKRSRRGAPAVGMPAGGAAECTCRGMGYTGRPSLILCSLSTCSKRSPDHVLCVMMDWSAFRAASQLAEGVFQALMPLGSESIPLTGSSTAGARKTRCTIRATGIAQAAQPRAHATVVAASGTAASAESSRSMRGRRLQRCRQQRRKGQRGNPPRWPPSSSCGRGCLQAGRCCS